VRELCAREGAATVVEKIAALVNARQADYEEAIRFLREGIELRELAASVRSSDALTGSLANLLASSNVRERFLAISALGNLPVPRAEQRLTSAAPVMLAESDLISLSRILQWVEIEEVVSTLASTNSARSSYEPRTTPDATTWTHENGGSFGSGHLAMRADRQLGLPMWSTRIAASPLHVATCAGASESCATVPVRARAERGDEDTTSR